MEPVRIDEIIAWEHPEGIICTDCMGEDDGESIPLTEDDLGPDYVGVCKRCGKRINW